MKKIILMVAAAAFIVGGYYGWWRYHVAPQVAQVKAGIAYQNEQFRLHNRWIEFKADDVYAAGFPFAAKVHVARPTVTFIWGEETYGMSLAYVDLSRRDATTYAVDYAPVVDGVYAKSGLVPEQYHITPDPAFPVLLRADKPGDEAPFTSFAAQLPQLLTLHIALLDTTKDVPFQLMPMPVPVYQPIPAEGDQVVEIFVNMLREAMGR